MTENRYNPMIILMHTAMRFEIKNGPRKPLAFFYNDKDFEKYKIEIEIKDSKEIYIILNSGLYKGAYGADQGRLIQDCDELEKKIDLLGKVVVKKEGKEIDTFNDFRSFEDTIQWG
jgi:hypothetical protein